MLRNSNSSRSFQSRTFKNNRVITSTISVILKPERSLYDDLFKMPELPLFQRKSPKFATKCQNTIFSRGRYFLNAQLL